MQQVNPRSFRPISPTEDDPTPTERSYIEIIYYLQDRREAVHGARLARWLGVRPPSVTHILQRLLAKGFITREGNGAVALSETGQSLAETIVRRHRLLERFLYDVVGMPWHQLHQESARLEPALSPAFLARIEALVGNATTCPHGNPIPGTVDITATSDVRLDSLPPGTPFTITRIDEEAGEDVCMLQRFWIASVLPGTECTRLPMSREGIALRIGERRVVLSRRAATLVYGTTNTK